MLFILVFVLRVLICVSRFFPGVSRLSCLKEIISINFGDIKDVYLAEIIQNTCSFNHSWQREGDTAEDLQAGVYPAEKEREERKEPKRKRARLLLLVSIGTQLHLGPVGNTQMPQSFRAQGLLPACGFSLEGWTVGRELPAPCQSLGTAAIRNI